MCKRLDVYLSREDKPMANKNMQVCSTSLVVREMQFKTLVRIRYAPTEMPAREKTDYTKCRSEMWCLVHCFGVR